MEPIQCPIDCPNRVKRVHPIKSSIMTLIGGCFALLIIPVCIDFRNDFKQRDDINLGMVAMLIGLSCTFLDIKEPLEIITRAIKND